jgi:hypothetical protein
MKIQPTTRVLQMEADALEAHAKSQLEAWILLGQADKYGGDDEARAQAAPCYDDQGAVPAGRVPGGGRRQ